MNRQTKSSVVPGRARLRAVAAAALIGVMVPALSACGQKGPLMLPKAAAPAASAASGSAR